MFFADFHFIVFNFYGTTYYSFFTFSRASCLSLFFRLMCLALPNVWIGQCMFFRHSLQVFLLTLISTMSNSSNFLSSKTIWFSMAFFESLRFISTYTFVQSSLTSSIASIISSTSSCFENVDNIVFDSFYCISSYLDITCLVYIFFFIVLSLWS